MEDVHEFAVFTIATDGVVDTWSRGAEAIFGWTSNEVIGQPFAKLFVEEDRMAGVPEREMQSASETGVAADVRWHSRKDGTRVFIEGTLRAVYESGQLRGFLKIGLDATARHRTDNALHSSELRYRTLLENVHDYGIFLLDERAVITEWMTGAERTFGYSAEEIVGRHVSILHASEEVASGAVERMLDEAQQRGRIAGEGWRIKKGGERFWVNEIAVTVHDTTGKFSGFTHIAQDLTQHRLLEKAAEVARADDQRGQLRQILLLAEEEERRRIARDLHDEVGQHLTALGLGLQSLSEIAVPGSEVDQRALQLRKLVDRMGGEMHSLAMRLRPNVLDDFGVESAISAYSTEWARNSGIVANVHIPPAAERLPPAVESAVYRVVQEALTNVSKHSRATVVGIIFERNGALVSTVVEDNGIGFDPHKINFAQTRGGLGLAGMRERVALLNGTVHVESDPGRGTTLFVRIPLPSGDGLDHNGSGYQSLQQSQ